MEVFFLWDFGLSLLQPRGAGLDVVSVVGSWSGGVVARIWVLVFQGLLSGLPCSLYKGFAFFLSLFA